MTTAASRFLQMSCSIRLYDRTADIILARLFIELVRIEPRRVIVCHPEVHVIHDPDIVPLAQIDVTIVRKLNTIGACRPNLHVSICCTRFDLLGVIVDQEDVIHLRKV